MDGIYQLTIGGNNTNGEYGENVCHYKITGSSGADDAYTTALALAGSWVTQCVADLEACIGTDVVINIMTVKKIDAPTGPTCFNAVAGAGLGFDISDSFANAIDIRLLPGGGGNRTGHWFVWGIPTGSFLAGIIDAGEASVVETFANDLLVPLNVLGGTANIGTFTKKTSAFTRTTAHEIVYDRATGMNKRTIPVL